MAKRSVLRQLTLGLVYSISIFQFVQAQTLSGRVYEGATGTEPPTATALSGVTVKLFGTNNAAEDPTATGTLITSTTTDAQGWYGLQVSGAFDYYNIVEKNPSGYNSDGATSVGGTVKTADWIQYMFDDLSGTTTGNKFWDKQPPPPNNPPISDANGPYTGTVNQPVTFDGSASYDPDTGDSIVSYEWDMDVDGQYDDATGIYPAWTWNAPTTTYVGLKVTDTHSATDTDSAYVEIEAQQTPCEALFDADPLDGCAPLQVQFTDRSSNAQSWLWKWYGQGSKIGESTQQNPSFTFQNPGTYSVFLKITCASGQIDSVIVTDYIIVMDCSEELDFGDAPDPSYPTLLASNGARHDIDPDVYLGASIDADPDGQPNSDASGDDSDGNDDEDGIVFKNAFVPGSYARFDITASRDGRVGIWVDFNQDGDWDDPGESAFNSDTTVSAGLNAWGISVPANAAIGKTFARFRYTTQMPELAYDGPWPDGEVEDYEVEIVDQGDGAYIGDRVWDDINKNGLQEAGEPGIGGVKVSLFDQNGNLISATTTNASGLYSFTNVPPGSYFVEFTVPSGFKFSPPDQGADDTIDSDAQYGTGYTLVFIVAAGDNIDYMDAGMYEDRTEQLDFGDAPDPTYPTILATNGARHIIQQGFFLGSGIDAEPDGYTSALSDGDDNNGSNDEDGVLMSPFIAPGQAVPITVAASAAGVVNAWIDFNIDGDWADPGEHIIPAMPVNAGSNSFTINVPAGAAKGLTHARFRFSSIRQLSYDGQAPDGEVEDYALEIKDRQDGSITVIKDAAPKDNTPFWMCASLKSGFFNIICFPLTDPTNNSVVFLNPGDVIDINEASIPGWTLTAITITGDTDNGSTIDMTTRTVTPDFDDGENIVITFKNNKTGAEELDFGDAPIGSQSASHLLGGPYLGTFGLSAPDADPGMQHSPQAQGDDADGNDDENCIYNISPNWVPGGSFFIDLSAAANGASHITIALWIDWNNDGDWEDSNELVYSYSDATTGWAPTFGFLSLGIGKTIPPTTTPGLVFARVRIVQGKDVKLTPGGPFGPGEVEDHPIKIEDGDIPGPKDGRLGGYKWKDLDGNRAWDIGEPPLAGWTIWLDLNKNGIKDAGEPQTITDPFGFFSFTGLTAGTFDVHEDIPPSWTQTFPGSPSFHSVVVDPKKPNTAIYFGNRQDGDPGDLDFGDAPPSYFQFAHASINTNIMIGTFVDIESAAQPDPQALGDDNSGIDDEDGVSFLTPIQPGQTASIQIDLTNVSPNYNPWLWAWIDFNGNGTWTDLGEMVINQAVVGGTMQTFPIPVPPSAMSGISFARFYLIDTGPLPPNGTPYGEVEDYEIEIGKGGGDSPLKWSQRGLANQDPDMPYTPYFVGWDELSIMHEMIVADDWYCKDPRPITDIHWRGSYQEWQEVEAPPIAPAAFHIGVWTNFSETLVSLPSNPGELIWQWIVPREILDEHVVGRDFHPEMMMEPDSCFQYDFIIPQDEWFFQEGDSTIYWLSIAAIYPDIPDAHLWGWLTRDHYFHSDAVRIMEPKEFEIGALAEVTEPVAEMKDMVFVLSTDEYMLDFDFGDAPADRYQTFMGHNGAHHFVDPAVHLGELIDIDPDGQPDEFATGDDNDGSNDDDGIFVISELKPNEPAEIEVMASTNGFLNAWIDFDNNGHWGEPQEHIFAGEPIDAGHNIRGFLVPDYAVEGKAYARFRFSKEMHLPPVGLAINGEVEDYLIDISPVSVVQNESQLMPKDFRLYQNYPNPFNPETKIRFDVKSSCHVELKLYDIVGHEIQTLVNGRVAAGRHQIIFNASRLTSGIYYYRIKMDQYEKTLKLLYLK